MPEFSQTENWQVEVVAFRAAVEQLSLPVLELFSLLEAAEVATAELELDLPLVDFSPFARLPTEELSSREAVASQPAGGRSVPQAPGAETSRTAASSPTHQALAVRETTGIQPAAGASADVPRVRVQPLADTSIRRAKARSSGAVKPDADGLQRGDAPTSGRKSSSLTPKLPTSTVPADDEPSFPVRPEPSLELPRTMLDSLATELWADTDLESGPVVAPSAYRPEAGMVRPQVRVSTPTANRAEIESLLPPTVESAEQGLTVLNELVDELMLYWESLTTPERPARQVSSSPHATRPAAKSPSAPVSQPEQPTRDSPLPPPKEHGRRATAVPPTPTTSPAAGRDVSPDQAVTPHLPLGPDDLAELVNQALVEQALRHGVDLL